MDQERKDNIVSGIEQLKLVLDYRANAKQNSYGKTQSKKYRESQSEIISITNIVQTRSDRNQGVQGSRGQYINKKKQAQDILKKPTPEWDILNAPEALRPANIDPCISIAY